MTYHHNKMAGTVRLLFAFLFFGFCAFFQNAEAHLVSRRFTLVIDPGHGGKDDGAVGTLTKEKDINLRVALAFGKLVETHCPDVKVVYTRSTDKFVPLQERADIANRNKADLFISIHTNSVVSNKNNVYGAETYSLGMHRSSENLEVAKRENSVITLENNYKKTYSNFDPKKAESYIIFELLQDQNMKQSVDLASCIQRQYSFQGRKNKGVKQSGFLVLRATSMPSVLTELGFISHAEEERFMHSNEGVKTLSKALFDGFQTYRRRNSGVATVDPSETDLPKPDAEPTPPTVFATDEPPLMAEVVPVKTRPFRPQASSAATAEENTSATSVAPTSPASPETTSSLKETSASKKTPAATSVCVLPSTSSTTAAPQPKLVEAPPVADVESSHLPKTEVSPTASSPSIPIFKVQLLTSDRLLPPGDRNFNGISPVEHYGEAGNYRYTHGETTNYKDAKQIRKNVSEAFPQAFIVAFLDGKRIELHRAIRLAQTSASPQQKK